MKTLAFNIKNSPWLFAAGSTGASRKAGERCSTIWSSKPS